MSRKRHLSTRKRIKAVVAIVEEEYQPGDQSRCYKAIWRRRVLPEFGICYKTFLSYIGVPPSEMEDEEQKEKEDPNQLSLFDQ